jgi:hypothetical protein
MFAAAAKLATGVSDGASQGTVEAAGVTSNVSCFPAPTYFALLMIESTLVLSLTVMTLLPAAVNEVPLAVPTYT